MERRARTIAIDGVVFGWSRRSRSRKGRVSEHLRVWLGPQAPVHLEIRFLPSDRCVPTVGQGYGGHEGGVLVDGEAMNLNLPSSVERLIRAALAAGWRPQRQANNETMDGVALLAGRH